ncbi:glycosyl hydrolase family 8 [Microbaculum marinum]|uniref:cellulase n=1 Tax=Microbaculum marinum TaxID=1764581 RepID=A0AAW9RRP6_9HYPH
MSGGANNGPVAGCAAAIRRLIVACCAATALVAVGSPLSAEPITVNPAHWEVYKQKFVQADGRVIDTANGDITHSEGQGYGMLLAFGADDPATFERIWTFTRNELLIRDDGLAAWKWDPAATPHISDINNATDGDILIAYALSLAGERWASPEYIAIATRVAKAVGEHMLIPLNGETIVLPGAEGFRDAGTTDEVVINLSYWVYPALLKLQELAADAPYRAAVESGTRLLARAGLGPLDLPSDWMQFGQRGLSPAPDRAPLFGYEGLRIPLYLMMAGLDTRELLAPFFADWITRNDGVPAVVNLETGSVTERLEEPGYRFLAALVACASAGTPIPDDLKTFAPTLYYPSTLHLLGLSVAAERYPRC